MVGEFVEPWVARAWARWDMAAMLAAVGLPVAPVDPDTLSARERDILPEWAADWAKRGKAARDKAMADARRR